MADKSFGLKQINMIGVGTPTVESSTDLIVNTNGSERVRITSSGNIGIGTENPQAVLHAYHPTSNTIINVESGDAGAVLNLIDPSQRSSIEQNGTTLKISSDTGAEFASSDIRLQVDGGTVMRAESTGNVKIDNGNLVFSTSGTGIDFSATSDATGMQSELLDDYEEGTWTPELADANTGGNTVTHQIKNGLYTKVGNVVTAYFRVTWTSLASASGIVRLRGFPFTAKSNSGQYYYMGSTANRHGQISVGIEGNNSVAIFFDSSSNAGTFSELSSADTSIGMNGTVTYLAD